MPTRPDLTSRHFGYWTVLGLAAEHPRYGAYWLCRCDPDRGGCGKEQGVLGWSLTGGGSTACRSCASGVKRLRKKPPPAPKPPRVCRRDGCGASLAGTPRTRVYCGRGCRPSGYVPTGRPGGPRSSRAAQRLRDAAIRVRVAAGAPVADVAAQYGVTPTRVNQIVREAA